MRFSFSNALLLAAAAAPLCAAAPMDPAAAPALARRAVPEAFKHAWNSVSGAAKTGAKKFTDFVEAHPLIANDLSSFVASAAGSLAGGYIACNYVVPYISRIRCQRPVKVKHTEVYVTRGGSPASPKPDHVAKDTADHNPPHDKVAAAVADTAPRRKPTVGEPARPVKRPGGDDDDDGRTRVAAVAYAKERKDIVDSVKNADVIGVVRTTTIDGPASLKAFADVRPTDAKAPVLVGFYT